MGKDIDKKSGPSVFVAWRKRFVVHFDVVSKRVPMSLSTFKWTAYDT